MDKETIIEEFNELSDSKKTVGQLKRIIKSRLTSEGITALNDKIRSILGEDNKKTIDDIESYANLDEIIELTKEYINPTATPKRKLHPSQSVATKKQKFLDEIRKDLNILILLYKYQNDKKLSVNRKDFEKVTSFDSKNSILPAYIFETLLDYKSEEQDLYIPGLWYVFNNIPSVLGLDKKQSKELYDHLVSSYVHFAEKRDIELRLTKNKTRDDLIKEFVPFTFKGNIFTFESFKDYCTFVLAYQINKFNKEIIKTNIDYYNYIYTDNTINYKNACIKYSDTKQKQFESNCTVCFLCGKRLHYEEYQKTDKRLINAHNDHIVPLLIGWITGIIHCPVNYSIVHGACNESKSKRVPFPNINIQNYQTLYNRLVTLSSTVDIETITDSIADELFKAYTSKLPTELQTEDIKKLIFDKFSAKLQGGYRPSINYKTSLMTQPVKERDQILQTIRVLEHLLDAENGYIVLDVIKFFYLVLDLQKKKFTGGGKEDNMIKAFFNSFDDKARDLKDNTVYMDIDDRVTFFKERIVLLMEFSFKLYEEYKPTKNYINYSDFIVDRVQHVLNYQTNSKLTFYH